MKDNNTLLLRQRLVRNMLSVKNNRIDSAQKVFKTNQIAHQAEKAVMQSGKNDYVTTAIAQRLKMLAEKRS